MTVAAAAAELIEAARRDLDVREDLASAGALDAQGYHPRMEAVHKDNGALLKSILSKHGWPDADRFGAEAADAAWLIAQHAIGDPPLQRRALALLRVDGDTARSAMLEDRIACFEGRPQRYGTQHDWDAAGRLSPLPIEDAQGVDSRRASVGLGPLAQETAELRARADREKQRPPPDTDARRAAFLAWAKRVGWR